MKTGKSLVELATEIQRQTESKRDFIAPTSQLTMVLTGEPEQPLETEMQINGQGTFGIQDTAHEQFSARLQIPKPYYDRMRSSAPALLAGNVNHWLQAQPKKTLVRTLDQNVRAFLSERYRPLDNFDLVENVLPVIQRNGCTIQSAELTERRLYIKATTERITAEVKRGDVVQAGIVISNSEIGLGSIKVEPMVFRLVCLNGAIANDHAMRKYHVGRGHGEGDMAEQFFRDATRQADDRAFWMKVRDVVEGSFNVDVFNKLVDAMRESTEREITGDPVKAVVVAQKKFGWSDPERIGVISHLIKGGDLSQYGLMNAVTRASQDVGDYDRATDMERAGFGVIELSKSDWKEIATAA